MTNSAGTRIQAANLSASPVLLDSEAPVAGVITLNVPGGTSYRYLTVKWRARASDAVTVELLDLQLNGDTASHYLWENVQGINGTSTSQTSNGTATSAWAGTICGSSATANYFSSGQFEIGGASDTTNFKTYSGTGTAFVTTTNMYAGTYGGQWLSSAAVTSLTLFGASGSLVSGSTASLYGSN